MNPARTSSLWLTASASAGASRRVGKYSWEARAIICCPLRLFERYGRSFRHRERRRLRVAAARRAVHPSRDPRVDLAEELVDKDVGFDLLQHLAVSIDEARLAAAGYAEVRVARLPRSVHCTAEHRNLEVLRILAQPLFDLFGERLHADVVASARRARDQDRAALTQTERLEDLPRDLYLLDRVGGEADAD